MHFERREIERFPRSTNECTQMNPYKAVCNWLDRRQASSQASLPSTQLNPLPPRTGGDPQSIDANAPHRRTASPSSSAVERILPEVARAVPGEEAEGGMEGAVRKEGRGGEGYGGGSQRRVVAAGAGYVQSSVSSSSSAELSEGGAGVEKRAFLLSRRRTGK